MLTAHLGREKKTNQHLHKSVALLQMLQRKYFFKSAAEKQKVRPTRVKKQERNPEVSFEEKKFIMGIKEKSI